MNGGAQCILFSLDAPIMDVYDDLAEKFPEAKVILSVREPGALLCTSHFRFLDCAPDNSILSESWFRSLDQVMLKPAIHNSWYYASAWWEPALWNQINMIRLVIDTWAAKYGNGTLGPQMMQGSHFTFDLLPRQYGLTLRFLSSYR